MGYAEKIIPHYTYDDYVNWEGRWELHDGHPIAMSPMPVPKHQWVAVALKSEFFVAIKNKKCKNCRVYDPLDYKLADDTIFQPDMLIVCKEISKKFLDFPPVLVVEVFSPSTVLRDKNTKFDRYRKEGVKYYLMVDIEKEIFELYELRDGEYILTNYDFSQPFAFTLDDECVVEVILNEIWEAK
jgi:Uma2 family endonuclease